MTWISIISGSVSVFPNHVLLLHFPIWFVSALPLSLMGQSLGQWRVAHWPGHSTAARWKAAGRRRTGRSERMTNWWQHRPPLLVLWVQGRLCVLRHSEPTSLQSRGHTSWHPRRVTTVLFREKKGKNLKGGLCFREVMLVGKKYYTSWKHKWYLICSNNNQKTIWTDRKEDKRWNKPNFFKSMFMSGSASSLIWGRVTSTCWGVALFMCSIIWRTAVSVILCSTCCSSATLFRRGSRM